MEVPLSGPDITGREIGLINQVLTTPYLSMGPMIGRFEEAMARYAGCKHAIGVSSGTAGLHLAVIAAGVGEGDLVITTPFSFVASGNCLLYERAVPVFVDVDPQTLNVDPALVVQAAVDLMRYPDRASRWLPPAMRDRPPAGRLKAILPVHVFGQPVDMDLLSPVAERYGLAMIEDACEALGAEYNGRKAGTLGDVAVFAFYPNKQMTTGEGGMVLTNDAEGASLLRSLRNQGRDDTGTWLNHVRLGYNYRLDELSAALGLAQLERIEELLANRERVAGWYDERLAEVEGVEIPHVSPFTTRVGWFVYVVRLAPHVDRDSVMARLRERGIPTRPYFPAIHLQPFYRERFGYREGDFPVAEAAARSTLALPFWGRMKESEVEYVCTHLREIVRGFDDA
jgi:perosamine synthetase